MKRQLNSSRTLKWLERNSLENDSCRRYVEKLCKIQFRFELYKISVYKDLGECLWITYSGYSYVIFIDKENIVLKVLEQKIICNNNNYHELNKIFYGDTCWYECLSWIKNKF